MTPRATYRVQFTKEFGFDHAARLVPYLARLGVSHLYASSYLKARPGSTHGYDVVDHDQLNPELGDSAAFERLIAALRAHGLSHILDFVPNHMGVGGSDNPLWLDVLEWGPASPYAAWFDIDWAPDRPDLHGKVLVPFLGEQLGVAIENGSLALAFDGDAGSFSIWAYDTHRLPVSPATYGDILSRTQPDLERIGRAFADLPQERPETFARAQTLKRELADLAARPDIRQAIHDACARFRGQPGEARSWSALEDLAAKQAWRAAHFRVAADDINYRRFFNIAELAGLRMERREVFAHAHRLVFALLERGVLDGLRIDHIDGLLDPKAYLAALRAHAPWSGEKPFYLVVEKILAEGESLRPDWPVDGTTGYEVTTALLGLMTDPAGEIGFARVYADFIREGAAFETVLRGCKKQIMDNEMASELAGLARAAGRIAAEAGHTADFTRNSLRRAIREIVAAFPVYRTYVDAASGADDRDRTRIASAVADARTHETAIDPSVYSFIESLLTVDAAGSDNGGFDRADVLRFAMKLQQYSGPVMAKGLEDTAFYRYNRFIALNEVGGDPRRFGLSPELFHAGNAERAARWPRSMLATSTHDTKRGEDARARLAALSELPDAWADAVAAWSACLRGDLASLGPDAAPDRNDEYALYQTLIATVPPALLDPDRPDPDAWAAYAGRVGQAMLKAMREAKLHTTWTAPNETYEQGMAALIATALTGERAVPFRSVFLPFARRIAELGVDNSLIQTALKLTMPGIPDIYQGTELWDLAMVDPDNRRPVDFALRERLMDDVDAALSADRPGAFRAFRSDPADGRIKLALVATLLALRRHHLALFEHGTYEPLTPEGPEADTVCAFARRYGSTVMAVVVARFPARRRTQPVSTQTRITLPPDIATWREILTGVDMEQPDLPALLSALPLAVLVGKA